MILALYEVYGIYSLLYDSAATYQHHYSLISFLNRYLGVPFTSSYALCFALKNMTLNIHPLP